MKKIKVVICTNIAAPYEVKYEKYLSKHFDIHYLYHSKNWNMETNTGILFCPKALKGFVAQLSALDQGTFHLAYCLIYPNSSPISSLLMIF